MEPGSQQFLQFCFNALHMTHYFIKSTIVSIWALMTREGLESLKSNVYGEHLKVNLLKILLTFESLTLRRHFLPWAVFVDPRRPCTSPFGTSTSRFWLFIRLFLTRLKEMIATQNEQNFQLSQIRGRCAVLVKPDYQSCRPVNITEPHIYFQVYLWTLSSYSKTLKRSQNTLNLIRQLVQNQFWREIVPTNAIHQFIKVAKVPFLTNNDATCSVIDDEYIYFEDRMIPLLPTPSPRLDQMVKQEIRKRSMEAQEPCGHFFNTFSYRSFSKKCGEIFKKKFFNNFFRMVYTKWKQNNLSD